MIAKLPSVKSMLSRLHRIDLQRAIEFLISKRPHVRRFTDIEDFIFSADHENPPFKGIEPNFVRIRRALAEQFWSNAVYLSTTVIDSLLFRAIFHTDDMDPIRFLLERIRAGGLHRPGVVLYPLHSLGVLGGGLLQWMRGSVQFTVPRFGITITPQTNSFDSTLRFLQGGAKTLGIKERIPEDLMKHWRKSRPTEWLERNPLMLARLTSFTGSYYENQSFLVTRLRLGTSLVLLAGALQPEAIEKDKDAFLASSSNLNNFQTLNLHHYFVFQPKMRNKKDLHGECVPMNLDPYALAELSELRVELDPRQWRRRQRTLTRVSNAMEYVGKLQNTEVLFKKNLNAHGRSGRKLLNSLKFFKRSFRSSSDRSDEAINLAIAIEVLLTDNYSQGVVNSLKKRASVALKSMPKPLRTRSIKAIVDTYDARSELAHSGASSTAPDINVARRAYAEALLHVVQRLPKVSATSPNPMKDIFGC